MASSWSEEPLMKMGRARMIVTWFAGVILFSTALSSSVSAQWPPFKTPGVPRNADGSVNLNAPVPRTLDDKPDLSGLWYANRPAGLPPVQVTPSPDSPPIATLGNVAGNMGESWLPMQTWAVELVKQRRAAGSKDNPEANCKPMGIMQFHTQGFPRRFIQTGNLLAILYEAWHGYRQIYLDGRPLPSPADDPQPTWYGYSTGRWEGDTLVVESTGFRDDGWLDIPGHPLTSAARVTERFTRVSYGRMNIDVTIDDPKAYTRPWTVRVVQQILVDQEMTEMICNENVRFLVSEQQHLK
jgi:hypothetical protein